MTTQYASTSTEIQAWIQACLENEIRAHRGRMEILEDEAFMTGVFKSLLAKANGAGANGGTGQRRIWALASDWI